MGLPFGPEMMGYYLVDNFGGPLAVLIPSTQPDTYDGEMIFNVKAITVDLIPDSYAHRSPPYSGYAGETIRFYGEGLEREVTFTVSEIESRQTKARTVDFGGVVINGDEPGEYRYRGIPIYDLLVEIGIKSNAGEVIVYDAEGRSFTFPLSALKRTNLLNAVSPEKEPMRALLAYGSGIVGSNLMEGLPLVTLDTDEGYDNSYGNNGGPLALIVPMEVTNDAGAFMYIVGTGNVVAIEVTANEIDSWGHGMSDVYSEFLDYEFTFTLRNDDSEWRHVFTLAQLEGMTDLIVRERYSVLDIGECEGLDIWKFVRRMAGDVPGIENPVSVTVYATDGYKNDLLSVFYKEGLELGIADEEGNRKPLIIAYAINGLPLVDTESHEGYTGLAGNTSGPLRVIAETNQGASVKYVSKLVVTIPGSGALESYINETWL